MGSSIVFRISNVYSVPIKHDIVGKKVWEQQLDDSYRKPKHQENNGAKHHLKMCTHTQIYICKSTTALNHQISEWMMDHLTKKKEEKRAFKCVQMSYEKTSYDSLIAGSVQPNIRSVEINGYSKQI